MVPATTATERVPVGSLPRLRAFRLSDQLLLIVLFCCSAVASLWMWHVGWHNSIYDSFSFRQTQTAISARSIEDGGPFLDYETPVLGPPWSVPFEFPLYQGLVGYSVRYLHLPLEETGRFYSGLFFYGMFIPLFYLLRGLGVERRHSIPFFCLMLMSPFYVYWSRTFMMESCALFFSVLYLALVLMAIRRLRSSQFAVLAAATALSGSMAGLVKVTTFAIFIIAGTGLIALDLFQKRIDRRRAAWLALCACLIPFLVTTAWTHHADAMKARNSMAAGFVSGELWSWTVGTLRQRLIPWNYSHFWIPVSTIVGGAGAALASIFALPFARSYRAFFICVGLWLCEIMIFFNLFYVHSYYSYANGLFLLLAIGFVVHGLLRRGGAYWWAGIYLLAFVMGSMFMQYLVSFYRMQRINYSTYVPAAQLIQKVTTPQEVILVYGLDWSSELPYAAHRRAIVDRYGPLLDDPRLKSELAQLTPLELGTIVACGPARNGFNKELLKELSFSLTPYGTASDCDIYVPLEKRQ